LPLDTATLDVTYVVARVPEEDSELLHFLVDSMIVPDHEIKIVGAAPYLGVLQVSTQKDTLSIGYNVAHEILVCKPSEG
jgi:Fe2+ transport system protein FeoA